MTTIERGNWIEIIEGEYSGWRGIWLRHDTEEGRSKVVLFDDFDNRHSYSLPTDYLVKISEPIEAPEHYKKMFSKPCSKIQKENTEQRNRALLKARQAGLLPERRLKIIRLAISAETSVSKAWNSYFAISRRDMNFEQLTAMAALFIAYWPTDIRMPGNYIPSDPLDWRGRIRT